MRRLLLPLVCAAAMSVASAAQSTPTSAANAALFDEVWKTINESFYDPSFGGLDWADVRDELRPKAAAAPTTDAARAVINEMLGRLKRSHFALLAASGGVDDDMTLKGEATVDIDFRVVGNDVVVTRQGSVDAVSQWGTPSDPATMLLGLKILTIDGHNVVPEPGTPPLTTWRRVNALLHGAEGSRAVIRFDKGGLNWPRRIPKGVRVQFSNLPPLHVQVEHHLEKTPAGRSAGVIAFNIWMAQIDQPVANAIDEFRAADGVIFDLRGNPGGLAALISNVAGHILTRADLLGTMRTRQIPQLKFVVNPRTSTTDGRVVTPYGGPVAILIDEMTASASECFTGGLQDLGRVRVFGRTSMGAALPASTRQLANGDVLEYVVGDFVTSKGRSLEGTGVVPDEIQPLSIASLKAGHDDPLSAALAWIDRESGRGR